MDFAAFYSVEAGMFFGLFVAVGFAVLGLSRPNLQGAKICAWLVAGLFISIAIVWGQSTPDELMKRIIIVGLCGFIGAAGLSEALRFISGKEGEAAA
jgi:hypothetical protein